MSCPDNFVSVWTAIRGITEYTGQDIAGHIKEKMQADHLPRW